MPPSSLKKSTKCSKGRGGGLKVFRTMLKKTEELVERDIPKLGPNKYKQCASKGTMENFVKSNHRTERQNHKNIFIL